MTAYRIPDAPNAVSDAERIRSGNVTPEEIPEIMRRYGVGHGPAGYTSTTEEGQMIIAALSGLEARRIMRALDEEPI